MFKNKEERIGDFLRLCEIHAPELDKETIVKQLDNIGFFTAPASTKYHGAYEGGLYDHSRTVTNRLIDLTVNNGLVWQNKYSPFVIGMFHDLCKCDQYKLVDNEQPTVTGHNVIWGSHYEYDTNTVLKGHGSKSAMLASQILKLTEEEVLCIMYHMGAYEKTEYDWSNLDMAIKKYQNCFWVHCADMLASKVDNV